MLQNIIETISSTQNHKGRMMKKHNKRQVKHNEMLQMLVANKKGQSRCFCLFLNDTRIYVSNVGYQIYRLQPPESLIITYIFLKGTSKP